MNRVHDISALRKTDKKSKKAPRKSIRGTRFIYIYIFYYTRILHAAAPIVPAQMT
jgi:hypothetical protein